MPLLDDDTDDTATAVSPTLPLIVGIAILLLFPLPRGNPKPDASVVVPLGGNNSSSSSSSSSNVRLTETPQSDSFKGKVQKSLEAKKRVIFFAIFTRTRTAPLLHAPFKTLNIRGGFFFRVLYVIAFKF